MGMFHNYIGCEHLLLGLLATEEGLASQVMRRMGVELRTTRRTVATVLAGVVHAKAQPAPAAAPVVAAAATEQSAPEAALQEILRRLEAIERRLPDAPA
jgi:ATP-dependent Clp protease ATP-binding subunit ClpC